MIVIPSIPFEHFIISSLLHNKKGNILENTDMLIKFVITLAERARVINPLSSIPGDVTLHTTRNTMIGRIAPAIAPE